MKHLIIIIAIFISLIKSSFAVQEVYTCSDLYQLNAQSKTKINTQQKNIAEGLFILSLPSSIIFPLPSLALLGFSLVKEIQLSVGNKEERVLNLIQEEKNKELTKLYLKAKEIDPGIKKENIEDLIEEGIRSGIFCESYPKLYSPIKVKKYILQKLRDQNSSSED